MGLTEVSQLIDSAISKRQVDQRKQSFLERKKLLQKWKMDSLGTLRTFLHISKCGKNITVKDNKKRMNITNFINIYANIYTYIICDKNDSK